MEEKYSSSNTVLSAFDMVDLLYCNYFNYQKFLKEESNYITSKISEYGKTASLNFDFNNEVLDLRIHEAYYDGNDGIKFYFKDGKLQFLNGLNDHELKKIMPKISSTVRNVLSHSIEFKNFINSLEHNNKNIMSKNSKYKLNVEHNYIELFTDEISIKYIILDYYSNMNNFACEFQIDTHDAELLSICANNEQKIFNDTYFDVSDFNPIMQQQIGYLKSAQEKQKKKIDAEKKEKDESLVKKLIKSFLK